MPEIVGAASYLLLAANEAHPRPNNGLHSQLRSQARKVRIFHHAPNSIIRACSTSTITVDTALLPPILYTTATSQLTPFSQLSPLSTTKVQHI